MEYERFAPLVMPHTLAMARVAAALVGVADAEDAAQEALARAWRAWPDLREQTSARAWLLQITVNVCRTWRARGQGLRTATHISLDAEPEWATRSAQTTAQTVGEGAPGAGEHAALLDLRQAVLGLSDDLRQVVALRFYAGMDSTQIGELLGEPAATVRGRLRRALLRLRETLDAADPADAADPPGANRTPSRGPAGGAAGGSPDAPLRFPLRKDA